MSDNEDDALCRKCNNDVKDSEDGLYCEGECQAWYHISCVGIKPAQYKKITREVSEILFWMCDKCRSKLKILMKSSKYEIHTQTLIEILDKKITAMSNSLEKVNTNITYAQVAKLDKNKSQKSSENLPSLIIKPKKTQDTQKTLTDLESKVKPTNICARIKSKKEISNGNVLIKFPSIADFDKVKNEVNKNLLNNYTIIETSLKKPRIKIPGVTLDLSKEEFEFQLRKQNFISDEEYFKVTYIKGYTEKKTRTIFAECSPKIFHELMYNQKIYLGWNRYSVYEDINVLQCYRCQFFHHKSSDCRNKKACRKCTEEHDIKDCHNQVMKCVNCERSNRKHKTKYDIIHEANDRKCPSYKYYMELAISQINYG